MYGRESQNEEIKWHFYVTSARLNNNWVWVNCFEDAYAGETSSGFQKFKN
jgi:hypothetical protein